MPFKNMDSFLSTPVQILIRKACSNHNRDITFVKHVEFGLFVLNEKLLEEIVLKDFDDESRERSPEWYNDVVGKLSPLFYDCHKILTEHRDALKQLDSCPYLKWLTTPKQFKGKNIFLNGDVGSNTTKSKAPNLKTGSV